MIIRKQPIKEQVNPRKRSKEINLTDIEKGSPIETPPFISHKVDYKGDTNEKNNGSDDSQSETDGCVINMAKEYEDEED